MTPLQQLRAWLAESAVEAAHLTNPVSIAYLTGFRCNPHERLLALVVRSDRAVLVVPSLERGRAEAAASGVEIEAWSDGEDPHALLGGVLRGTPRVAVEKDHLTLAAAETLRDRLGVEETVDAGPTLRRLRLLKTPAEVLLMQRAAEITDLAAAAVFGRLRPGITEAEASMLLTSAMVAEGGTPAFENLVQFGANSALPHGGSGGKRLEAGELVLLDFGAGWKGYCADITRMAVVGEPSAEIRRMYDAVLAGHNAAVAAVRPGATAGEIDAAARTEIARAGYGDRFIHRTGHGLGLEVHEAPSLDPGSNLRLEAGMVMTIEPGIYMEGLGGIRIEDDVLVTGDGGRLLTRDRRELRVIPAG